MRISLTPGSVLDLHEKVVDRAILIDSWTILIEVFKKGEKLRSPNQLDQLDHRRNPEGEQNRI
jgi:hypothetical protein